MSQDDKWTQLLTQSSQYEFSLFCKELYLLTHKYKDKLNPAEISGQLIVHATHYALTKLPSFDAVMELVERSTELGIDDYYHMLTNSLDEIRVVVDERS